MKIHIIGCSGSGKTTLARALSEKYQIPRFDLDDVYWDRNSSGYGVKTDEQTREKELNEILKNPDRIVEGVYYAWCEKCFETADTIYLLKIPRRVCVKRIWKRYKRRKRGEEGGKISSHASVRALVKWTKKFQKTNLPEIEAVLEKYAEKTVVLYGKKDVEKIING